MARKLSRKPSTTAPGTHKTATPEARDRALIPRKGMPVVSLDKVQRHAHQLRSEYPSIDDDTLALVILHVSTTAPIAAIAKRLGASPSWAYTRFARPEVQALTAAVALASLGVEAGRSVLTLAKLRDNTKDERLKKDIAVELLDRAGLGNTSAQRAAGTGTSFLFTFGAKPEPQGT